MVPVDLTPVLRLNTVEDTLVELCEELCLYREIVIKAPRRRIRRKFGVEFCLVPDLKVGSALEEHNKDDDEDYESTEDPVDKCPSSVLDCSNYEASQG